MEGRVHYVREAKEEAIPKITGYMGTKRKYSEDTCSVEIASSDGKSIGSTNNKNTSIKVSINYSLSSVVEALLKVDLQVDNTFNKRSLDSQIGFLAKNGIYIKQVFKNDKKWTIGNAHEYFKKACKENSDMKKLILIYIVEGSCPRYVYFIENFVPDFDTKYYDKECTFNFLYIYTKQ